MAQIFVRDESNVWSVLKLTDDVYRLTLPSSQDTPGRKSLQPFHHLRTAVIEPDRVERLSQAGALLLFRGGVGSVADATATGPMAPSEAWAVLAGAGTKLRVNGIAITVGIATLRDRDELCLDGAAPFYFSTERLVNVETYRASDAPRCPRCTLPIEAGEAYVCCPGCRVLHHQLPERECFTYSPTCTLCDQPSDLTAGYRWSPEDL